MLFKYDVICKCVGRRSETYAYHVTMIYFAIVVTLRPEIYTNYADIMYFEDVINICNYSFIIYFYLL